MGERVWAATGTSSRGGKILYPEANSTVVRFSDDSVSAASRVGGLWAENILVRSPINNN